jgi:hypothetical protein
VPGATIAYDSVGNMTQDNLGNTYSYDVEGRPVSAAGVQTTFDAFGRAPELNNGSTYTQMVYSPSGWRHAVMNGAALVKWLDPMVAGMAAVHNGDNTEYFQHADWPGSSRFAVTVEVQTAAPTLSPKEADKSGAPQVSS